LLLKSVTETFCICIENN